MEEWKVRIGDVTVRAASIEELRDWLHEERIRPENYVFHPVLQRWMYVKELEELKADISNPSPSSQDECRYIKFVPVSHQPTWSPGIAAVLSVVIPGAGQMYKGEVGAGVAWLVCAVIGYCLFIVPGFIIHLVCIVNAGSGKPA